MRWAWALVVFCAADGTYDVRMVPHGLGTVRARLAAEAAVHRDAEVGQVARCGGVPALQPGNPVDGQHDAQEHPGVAGLQVGERAEEAAVLTAQVPRPG